MSWADVFERGSDSVTVDEIRTALSDHRAAASDEPEGAQAEPSAPPEPSPTRVVADADVLAADVFGAGTARAVLDDLHQHSWIPLIASDRLIDDAAAVIEQVGDQALATEWREQIDAWRQPVDHPAGDHPALGSAYRGGAMHVLSFDDELTSSAAGATLNNHVPISVRQPDAFQLLFDPESLYAADHDGESRETSGGDSDGDGDAATATTTATDAYPGPDRHPRA